MTWLRWRMSAALLCSLLAARNAHPAGRAELLANLELDGSFLEGGELVPPLLPVGARVVFLRGPDLDREIWASDGTPSGTRPLRDIYPGPGGGAGRLLTSTGSMALFFASSTGNSFGGLELWATDGTAVGTRRLLGPENANLRECSSTQTVVAADGRVILGLSSGTGCELWVTDGTALGTHRLELDVDLAQIHALARAGEQVVVAGQELFGGRFRLWRLELAAPAALIELATFEAALDRVATIAGRAVFPGRQNGEEELWASDGTADGTAAISQLAAVRPISDPPSYFAVHADRLYFLVTETGQGTELWQSDGTLAGTHRVTDFTHPSPFDIFPMRIARVGSRLVFVANDGPAERLYASDGTPAGTHPLSGCVGAGGCPVPASRDESANFRSTEHGAVYVASTPSTGDELWVTDGTPGGTKLLRESCSGPCSGLAGTPVASAGEAFYPVTAGSRTELWRTNGRRVDTARVALLPDGGSLEDSVSRSGAAFAGGRQFLAIFSDPAAELWVGRVGSDQLDPVTSSRPFDGGSQPLALVDRSGELTFTACVGGVRSLYRSDGTSAGTREAVVGTVTNGCDPRDAFQPVGQLGSVELVAVRSPPLLGYTRQLMRVDDDQLSAVSPPDHELLDAIHVGGELAYLTRRTADEATILWWWADPNGPPSEVATWDRDQPSSLRAAGGRAYFVITGWDDARSNLWSSDGTSVGTRAVTDFELGCCRIDSLQPVIVEVAGAAVFVARDEIGYERLWRTTGSLASTALWLGADDPLLEPRDLWARGSELWLLARNLEGRLSLYRTDGTTPGTVRLTDLPPFFQSFDPVLDARLDLGGLALFAFVDDEHGSELWRSDGTPSGTHPLADLAPGPSSSSPSDLVAWGDRVYFAAAHPELGRELWSTDGTAEGTRLEQDIAPGPVSSSPRQLTASGGSVFFTADDGVFGEEPWIFRAGVACEQGTTTLCLGAERFRVEVAWRDFLGRSGTGQAIVATGDTGMFWFFDPANVELVVKLLDGTSVNDHRWVFYGALSSVEYVITVTDLQTGAARRYLNPPRTLASVADTFAFGPLGAHEPGLSLAPAATAAALVRSTVQAVSARSAGAPCLPTPTRLCLLDGRFAIEAQFDVPPDSPPRTAQVIPLAGGDTGVLWFFRPDNYEVIVKIRDGRAVNGKFWVFYGALSNVEYTLQVTDTVTGLVRTYANPHGNLASVADTAAF